MVSVYFLITFSKLVTGLVGIWSFRKPVFGCNFRLAEMDKRCSEDLVIKLDYLASFVDSTAPDS